MWTGARSDYRANESKRVLASAKAGQCSRRTGSASAQYAIGAVRVGEVRPRPPRAAGSGAFMRLQRLLGDPAEAELQASLPSEFLRAAGCVAKGSTERRRSADDEVQAAPVILVVFWGEVATVAPCRAIVSSASHIRTCSIRILCPFNPDLIHLTCL